MGCKKKKFGACVSYEMKYEGIQKDSQWKKFTNFALKL